jgi:pimeloyl-ACP methyl ester carboxylesterase
VPKKSTIVRSSAGERADPRTRAQVRINRIRPLFGALERAAPGLGARWAWRLWCTPTRPSPAAVAKSRAAGMGEVLRLPIDLPDWTGSRPVGPDGRTKPPLRAEIAVELLGPQDGPLVYLLHGWSGWRGQFAPIARALADAGYRAVLIDAPNHGDSGPGTLGPGLAVPPDFSLALAAAVRRFGPAHTVIGHSLGGGCVALALVEGLEAERVVFLSPAADPVAFTRQLARMLGFGERIRTRMIERGRRRIGLDAAAFVVPPLAARRTDLPPALVVHDRDDPTVPVSAGRALAGSWRDARLIETAGLGHNRPLRESSVIETVVGFVTGAGLPGKAPAEACAPVRG